MVQDLGDGPDAVALSGVTLTGLKPNTRYTYRVGDGTNWAEWSDFTTAAADLQQIETVLDQAYEFVLRIPSAADDPAVAARISALLHTIDHMHRLRSRLQNQPATDLRDSRYQQAQTLATELNTLAQQGLHGQAPADWLEQVQARAQALTELLSTVRSQLLAAPQGHDDASRTLRITDTHRWFERSSQHVWRSSYYLQLARQTQQ